MSKLDWMQTELRKDGFFLLQHEIHDVLDDRMLYELEPAVVDYIQELDKEWQVMYLNPNLSAMD